MTALTIAVPSKGRLKEKSESFFQECGYRFVQEGGERGYSARLEGLEGAHILMLPAREIAQGLIDGAFHMGITGEDLLHDLSERPGEEVSVLHGLGFGQADVIVAVPKAWKDVSTMSDLDAAGALFRARHGQRLRVATKYMRLTRRFFGNASVGEYRLIYSAGATEAAPKTGAADLIVDITSTGITLEANGLKVLNDGLILKSQAVLSGSFYADWSSDSKACATQLLAAVSRSVAGMSQLSESISRFLAKVL